MKRRLFTFLSALSAMLLAATCALWVRSYHCTDTVYREVRQYTPVDRRLEDYVASKRGMVEFRRTVFIYQGAMFNWALATQSHRVSESRRACPGDPIAISISDLMAPGDEEIIKRTRIQENGKVLLPYLGGVRLQGRTPALMEEALRDEYSEAGLIQSAQVSVSFDDSEEKRFTDLPRNSDRAYWTLTHDRSREPRPNSALMQFIRPTMPTSVSGWNRVGFDYITWKHSTTSYSFQEITCSIPYWAGGLIWTFLPVIWSISFVRRTVRVKANRCRHCGYDLRATPSRCPECGTFANSAETK